MTHAPSSQSSVGASGRRDFHFLLAGIFLPKLLIPLGALLAAYYCFWPTTDRDNLRWGRRIAVLVTVDLLCAVLMAGRPPHARDNDPLTPRVTVGITFEPGGAPTRVVVGETQPGSPAARAGVLPGDTLLALDGRPVVDREWFRRAISSGRSGVARTLRLRRGQAELDATVVPDDRRRTPRRPVPLFASTPHTREDASPWSFHRRDLVGLGLSAAILLALCVAARRHGPAATRPVLATALLLFGSTVAPLAVEVVLPRTVNLSLGVGMILMGLPPLLLGLSAAWVRARFARRGLLAPEPPPTHSLGTGFALAVWYLLTVGARVGVLLPFLESVFHTRSEPGAIREIAASLDFTLGGAALGFAVVALAAPLGEELLFRSLLLPGLLAWCTPAAAIVISAALFAVLHVPQYGIGALLIVVYGLVLGWVRLATGRLLAPVLLHVFINTVVFAAMASRVLSRG